MLPTEIYFRLKDTQNVRRWKKKKFHAIKTERYQYSCQSRHLKVPQQKIKNDII